MIEREKSGQILHSKDLQKEDLYIIKIGGNVIDNEEGLVSFLKDFSNISAKKILVHDLCIISCR